MADADESPHGLGPSDTRVHESWYLAWYRLYVVGPRDVLRGRDTIRTARAHRAALLKRPRL